MFGDVNGRQRARGVAVLFAAGSMMAYSGNLCAPANTVQATTPQQRARLKRLARECATVRLAKPVSLPHVSEYRGDKPIFTQGYYVSGMTDRQFYVLNYLTKEPADKVMESYRSTLPGQGWTIKDAQTSKSSLTAQHSNAHALLTVRVSPFSGSGYQARLNIQYRSW